MCFHIKNLVVLDNCLIYTHITYKEDQVTLNMALSSAHAWCTKRKMKINHSKTSLIRLTNKIKNILPFGCKIEGQTKESKPLQISRRNDK